MIKEIKNNECRSICARCGGECCLRMPGAYFPEQLGLKEDQDENNAKVLEAVLFSNYGKCQLVDGIGEPSSYNICGEYEPLSAEELADYDWCCNLVILPAEGRLGCCHWSCSDGCQLSWEKRPTMCKALSPSEPNAEGRRYCQSEISLRELSRIWKPYQDILKVCKDLRELRKQHREVWDICYGSKSNITKEVILFFLRKEEDVWSFCFRKSEEKRQEEEKRIKEENNPLFAALKNAGF